MIEMSVIPRQTSLDPVRWGVWLYNTHYHSAYIATRQITDHEIMPRISQCSITLQIGFALSQERVNKLTSYQQAHCSVNVKTGILYVAS